MFEKLKKRLQEKIEKNAVKSELTWIDSFGNVHIDKVLLKRSQMWLVGDWERIYPPINEDGTWNITNLLFGGKKNLIKLVVYVILVGIVLLAFYEIFHYVEVLRSLPCFQSCLNPINLP